MIRLLIIALIVICVVILQVVLSRTKSKIPGLILPVLMILCYLPFMYAITGGPNILWIIAAIPIIVFLVIYFLCRRKYQNNEMDKMRIQDLE
ncbi:MAG: hypothetical protein IKT36_03905 [Methanocorpusculum sp.]|nr:hypothetical protein [Methanocorpusculum sp.]MBR5142957.1 hypothetical protein [Methanocorpusculum sp.]